MDKAIQLLFELNQTGIFQEDSVMEALESSMGIPQKEILAQVESIIAPLLKKEKPIRVRLTTDMPTRGAYKGLRCGEEGKLILNHKDITYYVKFDKNPSRVVIVFPEEVEVLNVR